MWEVAAQFRWEPLSEVGAWTLYAEGPPALCPARCPCSTTVFSHSQTVVVCPSCNTVLCVPTGGKARLTEGACRG